ncbi:MAG: hypothetical protein ACYC3B_05830 [Sedimentisphaerales bacterium]
MLMQILAMTVTDGDRTVELGSLPIITSILQSLCFVIIIGLFIWYFLSKKRLEHQQIMAAIEKGTSLSELRPVKKAGADWIKNITAGIALILIGLGLVPIRYFICGGPFVPNGCFGKDIGVTSFISLVILALGVSRLLRGILQRKADKALSTEKSDNRVG